MRFKISITILRLARQFCRKIMFTVALKIWSGRIYCLPGGFEEHSLAKCRPIFKYDFLNFSQGLVVLRTGLQFIPFFWNYPFFVFLDSVITGSSIFYEFFNVVKVTFWDRKRECGRIDMHIPFNLSNCASCHPRQNDEVIYTTIKTRHGKRAIDVRKIRYNILKLFQVLGRLISPSQISLR